MLTYDNPAARLHQLLGAIAKKQGGSTLEALHDALDLAQDAPPKELMRALCALYEELEVLDNSIRRIPSKNRRETYQRVLAPIHSVLDPKVLNRPWGERSGQLDHEFMTVLKLCADDLSETARERPIDEGALKDLYSQIEEVLTTVLDHDELDSRLRDLLVQHLEEIRRAIVNYRIRGARSLEDAFDSSIGSIVRNRAVFQNGSERQEVKSFRNVLSELAHLITIVRGVAELGSPVMDAVKKLLP